MIGRNKFRCISNFLWIGFHGSLTSTSKSFSINEHNPFSKEGINNVCGLLPDNSSTLLRHINQASLKAVQSQIELHYKKIFLNKNERHHRKRNIYWNWLNIHLYINYDWFLSSLHNLICTYLATYINYTYINYNLISFFAQFNLYLPSYLHTYVLTTYRFINDFLYHSEKNCYQSKFYLHYW